MNPNIAAQATRRNMQPPIWETGWGKPHKDAIIVGERKRAAPHGSCGAGGVPRGPVARGSECRMAGFHGGGSQGRGWLLLAAGMSRSNSSCYFTYQQRPRLRGAGFKPPYSFCFLGLVSSGGGPWLRIHRAVPGLVGCSDLKEHKLLGLGFK